MSDATDRTAARVTLLRHIQAPVAPVLDTADDGEVDEILDANKIASTWVASTAYVVGQIIMPTVRNGHKYRCAVAGTSGTTQPSWLTSQGVLQTEGTSNPSLQWEEWGPQVPNVYDVNAAARECWLLKQRKASEFITVDGTAFDAIYKHCGEMAASFVPVMAFA